MGRIARTFAATAVVSTVTIAMMFTATAASAAPPAHDRAGVHHVIPHLINTDRVVGFPQHATGPVTPGFETHARDTRGRSRDGGGGGGSQHGSTAPVVTTEPASQSAQTGATVTFSAAATGDPTPTVQWRSASSSSTSFTDIRGATGESYTLTNVTAAQNGEQFEAVFTNKAGTATTTAATLTVSSAPATPSLEQSTNWSGYANTGTVYTAVTGSWAVPAVTCTRANTYSAQWVGIDGDTSATVEQDGTEADCLGGVATYDAWYEMYGDNAVNSGDEVELGSSTPVKAGDQMTASVTVNPTSNQWTLAITDTSAGWTSTVPVTYSGAARSSAEWIVERPDICTTSRLGSSCTSATLSDFSPVTFTTATTDSTTGSRLAITANDYAGIEMTSTTGTPLAIPTTPTNSGTSFTDTYQPTQTRTTSNTSHHQEAFTPRRHHS